MAYNVSYYGGYYGSTGALFGSSTGSLFGGSVSGIISGITVNSEESDPLLWGMGSGLMQLVAYGCQDFYLDLLNTQ